MTKKILVIALLFILNNCSLTPLYKANHENYDVLAAVDLHSVTGEKNHILRSYLLSSLNPNNIQTKKTFKLDISVSQAIGDTLVQKDSTTSQSDMIVTAVFSLRAIKDDKEIKSGTIKVVTNFEDNLSSYASFSQRNKAYEVGLKEIVRSIKSHILIALLNKNYIVNED